MYTIAQFCEVAKISTRDYYTLSAQGLGPDPVHLGRSVRITEEAAQEWIARHTEPAA
jgi:predicted DNA-binding transcriptional regulator AlpA